MSGFSAAWLALREPLDHAARSAALLAELVAARGDAVPWRVVDLGAGSGSNLRYLQARLGDPQCWTLVDHDGALLGAAMADPALQDGRRSARARQLDLARQLDSLEIPRAALVTASALLDLVSADWVDALVARCRQSAATVLFALNYDGRSRCDPADPLDPLVLDLVNRHQRTDKGFGPALGPDATDHAERALTAAGYTVRRARSDWQIAPEHARLQIALIEGWAAAAAAIAPPQRAPIAAWRQRRIAHVDRGDSSILVGHEDLAAWPQPSRP